MSDAEAVEAPMSDHSDRKAAIRKRRVHYLSGFDPRGARYYHRLFREEAARQSVHSGAHLQVGSRTRLTPSVSSWRINSDWKGELVETDYLFMGWDDIVRKHWETNAQMFARSLPVYLKYILVGGFNRVALASRNAFYTSVYPMVYLLTRAAFILLISLITALGLTYLLPGQWWTGAAAGLALYAVLGRAVFRRAEKRGILWLLRTCIFVVKWGSRPFPDIDRRVAAIADQIVEMQAREPVDEVLIMGHSIGTMLSLSVIARLLERSAAQDGRFRYVTFGQCIPYLGVMTEAEAFRRDLALVAADTTIPWTDFTAPPDPLCFFKTNPATACGIEPGSPDRPRQLAVRIFRMFSRSTYSRIRRDKLRVHFQYLMASELPADYDFFAITTGPRPLSDYVLPH